MGLCLPRYLGPVETLPVGEWTWALVVGTSSVPAIRCRSCGGIEHLAGPAHSVGPSGIVTPRFVCSTETCGVVEWLALEGWDT